jgi:hypothetical protein
MGILLPGVCPRPISQGLAASLPPGQFPGHRKLHAPSPTLWRPSELSEILQTKDDSCQFKLIEKEA